MDDQGLYRRYALSLALVPEVDVAGDLFMNTTTEAALWEAAAAWRKENGYPPAPLDSEPVELDEFQQEHARHLARRAGLRRRTQLMLTVAVGAALVGLTVLAWPHAPHSTAASPRISLSGR